MTHDEAIAIRTRQLSGEYVSASEAAEAMRVIQNSGAKPRKVRKICRTRDVLEMLATAPMDREEFYEQAAVDDRGYGAIARLKRRGLIKIQVSLTAAGLWALGLKGPI